VVLAVILGRQNRDLLRVGAYGEFVWRLGPVLCAAVFIAGFPFVLDLATPYNIRPTILVYIAGAAILTALAARGVAPEERRASVAFRKGDLERAVTLYEELAARTDLPRHYCSLAAALDATGDPHGALEAAETAVKRDPSYGIALYNRASALAALGETARARGDLQKVFTVDSSRGLRHAAEEALESLEGR
jgi:tetratricopeptide (TPR) repeat protein